MVGPRNCREAKQLIGRPLKSDKLERKLTPRFAIEPFFSNNMPFANTSYSI